MGSQSNRTDRCGRDDQRRTRNGPTADTDAHAEFGVADAMILLAGFGFALAGGLKLLVALTEQCYCLCEVIAAYNSPFYANRPAFWRSWVAIYWSSALFYAIRVFGIFLLGMTRSFLVRALEAATPAHSRLVQTARFRRRSGDHLRSVLADRLASPPVLRQAQGCDGDWSRRRRHCGSRMGRFNSEPPVEKRAGLDR